ncbi:TetR/AcrR family transcriptional regulator [Nonomuraea sp. ATR24]|uniref:TetR/AcrR family transcriptional regulator n=1 Tax=Nonomuraea TaxID=83681 RepID=UPI001C607596|nr:TetR/AcrR family transcriptional regulator [Nonomuraea ceibae]
MSGLRERKKQRTRRALADAAIRMFTEKGYEETTIAEIAAAADVSTRTFFGYFASKEDVVFYDSAARLEELLARVADRRPGEPVAELLTRVLQHGMDSAVGGASHVLDEAKGRMDLIMSVPALQARGLRLLFDSQLRLAEAVHEAYAGELDLVEAAAVVGSLVGAVKLATMASLNRGDVGDQVWEVMAMAAGVAVRGLAHWDPADPGGARPGRMSA